MTAPEPDDPVDALLDTAEQAYAIDDVGRARRCYQDVLAVAPEHPLASRALAELERHLNEQFAPESRIELIVELAELVRCKLPATEAFTLSRIAAGSMTVTGLETASGIQGVDLRVQLQSWVVQGFVSVSRPKD